jgi:hypothetical protein
MDERLLCVRLGGITQPELDFLVLDMEQRKLLSAGRSEIIGLETPDGIYDRRRPITIRREGWELLEPLSGGGVPGTCFVAMSFDRSLDKAYDVGIEPAVRDDCGFSIIRTDRVEHNESVNDQILAGIRKAQFTVADVTMQRNGVYFEGGFALGLGRQVVWTVRADDVKNVHFDTSHLSHVVWADEQDLRTRLTARIRATIPGAKL